MDVGDSDQNFDLMLTGSFFAHNVLMNWANCVFLISVGKERHISNTDTEVSLYEGKYR